MTVPKFTFTKRHLDSVFGRLGDLDWTGIANFLNGWQPDTKGYITIHKEGKSKSLQELGYYYGLILPTAFDAFKDNGEIDLVFQIKTKKVTLPLTIESVDLFLKINYGGWHGNYKDKGDMSMAECAAFMTWVIRWLAKWFNVHIPPADTQWKEKLEAEGDKDNE